MENQKIEQVELESLQNFQTKINEHLLKIGDLEALKADVLASFSVVKQEYKTLLDELEAKYGKVNINITNGEISEVSE